MARLVCVCVCDCIRVIDGAAVVLQRGEGGRDGERKEEGWDRRSCKRIVVSSYDEGRMVD